MCRRSTETEWQQSARRRGQSTLLPVPIGVFAEKTVKEDTPADIAKVRKIYIRQVDLDAFGYTPGCKKC